MTETSSLFPAIDPIPLPAPVWLFKALHMLTLSLHFVAVGLLLGGLFLGLFWHLTGNADGTGSRRAAARSLAELLPTVMAYVINLGIPPLLFTQVLYGRAFYTSSVLIGAYWISVILLLIASYYGLYAVAKRAERGQGWGLVGSSSLVLALAVGFIYSSNLTLMLRPEVWSRLYEASPGGLQLNGGDPTVLPRWIFMVAGGLPAAGALVLLLSRFPKWSGSAEIFRRHGSLALAAGLLLQASAGALVFRAQPAGVAESLSNHAVYGFFPWIWLATAALAAALALLGRSGRGAALLWGSALAVFLNIAATVVARDGLRDLALARLGFDVWQSPVVTNWSVVLIFLLLFVAGLAVIAWMLKLAAASTSPANPEESYV
jgi:hypothetical protein